MQITSLPATTNLSANDVLAVEVNGITYKITASNLAGILQTLGGTLPIAKGGTGMTSSPSLQVNLASSSAANVLQASPRPGVTGILPLANGGLGTSDPAQARTALEVSGAMFLNSADWSDIKTKLESIAVNGTSTFISNNAVTSLISNNSINNSQIKGLISRSTSTSYDIMAMISAGSSSGQIATWRISNLSNSGATVASLTRYLAIDSGGGYNARSALESSYAKYYTTSSGTSFTFSVPNSARTLFIISDSNVSYNAIFFVIATNAGTVNVVEVFPGSFTYDKTVANKITFERATSGQNNVMVLNLKNTQDSIPTLDTNT